MTVFYVLLVLLGSIITYISHRNIALGWASRRWPHTVGHVSGRVVYEGVRRGVATDGTYAPKDVPFRDVDWRVTYSVSDEQFQTSRFSFASTGWHSNTRYYEDGDEVKVYYCPSNPAIAVIRPGLRTNLLLGPFLLIVGLGYPIYQAWI